MPICRLLGIGCDVFALFLVTFGTATELQVGCCCPPSVLTSDDLVVSCGRSLLWSAFVSAAFLICSAFGRRSGPNICIREEGLIVPTS